MAYIPSSDNSRPSTFGDPFRAYALAEFFLGQFAKTIIVFFRYDFGERYFNVADMLGSTATFIGIGFFIVLASEAIDNKGDAIAFTAFLIGFLAMSILHRILAWQYKKIRPHWHSRYSGTSFVSLFIDRFETSREIAYSFVQFFGVPERYIIQRYIEPGIAFFASIPFFFIINRPLGVWLMVSSMSLAVTEWLAGARSRDRILDAIDAQIESQNLNKVIAGETNPAQTDGFVLPVPSYYEDWRRGAERQTLYEGMTKLDPTLQAMMKSSENIHDTIEPK